MTGLTKGLSDLKRKKKKGWRLGLRWELKMSVFSDRRVLMVLNIGGGDFDMCYRYRQVVVVVAFKGGSKMGGTKQVLSGAGKTRV